MKRRSFLPVVLGRLLPASLVCALAHAAYAPAPTLEFGIDRSNLTTQSEAVQEKTLQDIRALHATWFRDVLVAASHPAPKFLNEVRLAKQNGLKFLANVLPSKADFGEGYQPPNAGEDFRRRCGWSQGSSQLSRLDVAKFAATLSKPAGCCESSQSDD